MLWTEDTDENTEYVVPDDVVDLVYGISCKCLPLDHAFAFSQAILERFEWMGAESGAGIHLIHGAESGNGWMRPEDPENQLLHLSRRSRMTLRVPRERVEEAHTLTGTVLDIDGYRLEVGKAKERKFSTLPTQFARYIVIPSGIDGDDEDAFIDYVVGQMREMDVRVKKMLCGLPHTIRHPDGDLQTRSVMTADLEVEQAVALQQHGVGEHRHIGCGLFIPHKGIRAVHEMNREKK